MLKFTRFTDVTRIDSARTIAGRGYYWTSAYLADGLLIDTGCAHTAGELVESLRDEQVSQVANTHSHEDHIGANGILKNRNQAIKVHAHPLALPILESPRAAQPLHFYRRVMWGWPLPSTAQPLADGDVVETEKYSFQVIYTPGHSPDHLCLYEQTQGWLFTGDLFVGGKDRALRVDYRIWEIIASLKRVAKLPLTRLFP
ncbi:MAG: MBL fold metallo-hydrolase, partial [Chloroflexota bacterium]